MTPINPNIKHSAPQASEAINTSRPLGTQSMGIGGQGSNSSFLASQLSDTVTFSSQQDLGHWNDVMAQNRLRAQAMSRTTNGNSGGQMLFGEKAGVFHEARANSKAMHQIADIAVDRHGALSPKALTLRAMATFYDISPAPAAQEAGEAWGDPSVSKGQKAWATTKLGLQVLEAFPVAKTISGAANGLSAMSTASRSSRTGRQSMGMVGAVRRRQSVAGFAKTPDKAKATAAASQSARPLSQGAKKVANTSEFFESTDLGKALVDNSKRTKKSFQGAPIYKVTEKVKIGETTIKKGFHYYLDNLHKDHIEVFDKRGVIQDVLDFSGKRLKEKLQDAEGQGRTIKDLVSDGNSMSQSNVLA